MDISDQFRNAFEEVFRVFVFRPSKLGLFEAPVREEKMRSFPTLSLPNLQLRFADHMFQAQTCSGVK